MPQNLEATAFLARVAQLPPGLGVSLDTVLQPSLQDEAVLRNLFAQDKANVRLGDPHVGLIDVFDAPADIRVTRARVVQNEDELSARYIMPLSDNERRKDGTPCMVDNLEDFKKNWAVFTEGSLSQLTNWNNVIAAGGAVQACLAPIPDAFQVSKRALRKHFHSYAFPTSDVDLFLYGLTPEQAEVKINEIYEAVRDSIPWDVTCIRTKHTISIHSQYPYRSVQIVLRLYQSPAEILTGFDVDAPCCAYDGDRVWANPRAIIAMMRQCNTVDITRRSPSYEVRLAKYSSRGFEIFTPELDRGNIDPTIFERSIVRIQGLARLLVLEKLATAISRDNYTLSRRTIRGRPYQAFNWKRHAKKKYKGDLKQDADAGLELSDYDVVSLHIPYGPGWDSRRIEKLVYQTDLGMNSPYNSKNAGRKLHRHPAFFGTMKECMEDCCEHCPEPRDTEERELQEQEDKSYIRGRVTFIEEDPGRQSMSGSFNPIDEGEWSEQAYMGATEKFFAAIVSHDKQTVKRLIEEGSDVDRRDHVGRTPLQVAILAKAEEIACELVDAGARMTSRLVDGRTALHLAALQDMPVVVRKLLERSAVNAETARAAEEEAQRQKEAKESNAMETDEDGSESAGSQSVLDDSSEDDWSSDSEDKLNEDGMNIPEDDEGVPDVFDINVQDWDFGFTALNYAIVGGSIAVVELLISSGADTKLVSQTNISGEYRYSHPLLMTVAAENEDDAFKIARKLLAAGAVSSEADEGLFTIFHRMVCSARPKLVSTLLQADPNAKTVLNIPYMDEWSIAIFPIVSALISGSYSTLAVLLAHGAKLIIAEEDFQRARDLKLQNNARAPIDFQRSVAMPAEVAMSLHDDVIHLLVALGAEINLYTKGSTTHTLANWKMTYLDYVRTVGEKAAAQVRFKSPSPSAPLLSSARPTPYPLPTVMGLMQPLSGMPLAGSSMSSSPGLLGSNLNVKPIPAWKRELQDIVSSCNLVCARDALPQHRIGHNQPFDQIKTYFNEVEALLTSHGAKTALDISPQTISENERKTILLNCIHGPHVNNSYGVNVAMNAPYCFYRLGPMNQEGLVGIGTNMATLYDDLFSACWDGDNVRIQQLCLPQTSSDIPDAPIQIAVRWGDTRRGYTPLHVAFLKKRWDTARLILAIATAQFSPPELKRPRFNARNIVLDNDSDDNESEDEDMEDETAPEPISFIDIAKRPSVMHSSARPVDLLRVASPFSGKEGKVFQDTLIVKAIIDDDFEAFAQALDLCSYLEEADRLSIFNITWASLIAHDRPAMLDAYIRRTGLGISITAESNIADDEDHEATKSSQMAYLGLNVHGKKRKDLANPNTNYTPSAEGIPMLWIAAKNGSVETVRYLASDQPLAAYNFYASSHSDRRAKLLKHVPDFAAILPAKLGWMSSHLNESVLTATIVANRQDIMEMLFALRPVDMENFVHLRQKTLQFNNILAAARWACDPKMFDFLLGKKVSAMEVDYRGWNIYHILCAQTGESEMKLLKHVLHQLPKEMTEFLLRQQSKDTRNTPLHIAVKNGRLDLVRLLVDTGADQYLQRDFNGCTPLHIAVKFGHPEITRLVAAAGPAEALSLEDGVGNTALETATRQAFTSKLSVVSGPITCPRNMQPQVDWDKTPFDVAKQEAELPRFKATIQSLLDEGRLINGTKLTKELLAFAERLEGKIATEKQATEERKNADAKEDGGSKWVKESDICDLSAIVPILLEAITARPGHRRLVHLSDVLESVQIGLQELCQESKQKALVDRDDEPEPVETKPTVSFLTSDYCSGGMVYGDHRRDVWARL